MEKRCHSHHSFNLRKEEMVRREGETSQVKKRKKKKVYRLNSVKLNEELGKGFKKRGRRVENKRV